MIDLNKVKVTILGSGTWGTALANLLAAKHVDVLLYSRFENEKNEYESTRRHPHLSGVEIHKDIKFTCDLEYALKDRDIILLACPSLYVRETCERLKPYHNKNQIFISVAKGIESHTLLTMTQVIEDVLGDVQTCSLSGPTHAEEVSIGLPTLIVASSSSKEVAETVQQVFSSPTMRVYTNTDINGVELCGALKNIIALASGMSRGLGFGDNAQAAIITRGLNEIITLGTAMGCHIKTFSGLTGIGDIVVTASSRHSRNFNAGILLAQGKSLEETLKEVGMVVEGINALVAAKELEKKYNVEMPITDAVYEVVYGHLKPKDVLPRLFGRSLKSEI